MDPDEIPVAMPYILGLIDNRMAWAAHSIEVEDLFAPLGPQSLETFRGIIDIGLTTDWIKPGRGGPSGSDQIPQFDNEAEWDSWIEEGTDGDDDDSTEEENMELLCQRFKTWHDDPWVSVLVWMRLDAGFVPFSSALLIPLFRLFVTRSILPDIFSIFIAFTMLSAVALLNVNTVNSLTLSPRP